MPNMSGWHGSKFGEREEVQEGGGWAVPLHLGRLPRLGPRAQLQAGGRGGGLHLPAPPAEEHQGPGAVSHNIYNISTIYLQLSTAYLHDISTIPTVLPRTRLRLGRRRCCTTAPRCSSTRGCISSSRRGCSSARRMRTTAT